MRLCASTVSVFISGNFPRPSTLSKEISFVYLAYFAVSIGNCLTAKYIDFIVKHVQHVIVKTMTIRDLRQRWPQAEAALQTENEILITRDSKPVAKLVRVTQTETPRNPWDPQAHLRWLKRTWGGKQVRLVNKYLQIDYSPVTAVKCAPRQPLAAMSFS